MVQGGCRPGSWAAKKEYRFLESNFRNVRGESVLAVGKFRSAQPLSCLRHVKIKAMVFILESRAEREIFKHGDHGPCSAYPC